MPRRRPGQAGHIRRTCLTRTRRAQRDNATTEHALWGKRRRPPSERAEAPRSARLPWRGRAPRRARPSVRRCSALDERASRHLQSVISTPRGTRAALPAAWVARTPAPRRRTGPRRRIPPTGHDMRRARIGRRESLTSTTLLRDKDLMNEGSAVDASPAVYPASHSMQTLAHDEVIALPAPHRTSRPACRRSIRRTASAAGSSRHCGTARLSQRGCLRRASD